MVNWSARWAMTDTPIEAGDAVAEARADVDEITAFLCQAIRDSDPIAMRAFYRAKPIFYRRLDAFEAAVVSRERERAQVLVEALAVVSTCGRGCSEHQAVGRAVLAAYEEQRP